MNEERLAEIEKMFKETIIIDVLGKNLVYEMIKEIRNNKNKIINLNKSIDVIDYANIELQISLEEEQLKVIGLQEQLKLKK